MKARHFAGFSAFQGFFKSDRVSKINLFKGGLFLAAFLFLDGSE